MDAITPPNMLADHIKTLQDPPKPTTHDVTIVTTRKHAQAKVMGVPPEEFGIERSARTIKDCNYCFHDVVTKTQAQLIAEGFDKDQVRALGDYTGQTEPETLARDSVQEHYYNSGGAGANSAARLVRITEHYVRMDYEGNNKPCLYQVITGGDQGQILKKDGKECITPYDAMPFACVTPVPITHRFFGRSIADLVMDIQRVKTALLRGTLDNSYMVTNPRNEIAESHAGPNTLDDLLTSRPNGVIRTKLPGGLNVVQTPPIGQYLLPVMGYMDSVLESRTGLSKQSQGLDANALQNQSATAVAQAFSASQMRMKLVARIIAEGVRDLFSLLHGTIRKHGQQQQTVRLRGKWIEVDPRDWKNRNDMTVNVGLGTGGKAQQFAQIMALANFQGELIKGNKANLVDDQALFNTASEITKIMGHRNPDRFFNDPSAKDPKTGQPLHPPIPPPPDPKVQAVQAQAEADKAELGMKAELDKQKAQDAAALAKFKAQIDAEMARQKADVDAKLKLLDAHLKSSQMVQTAHHEQKAHHAKIAETVIGVIADAHKHDQAMEHNQATHEAKIEQMKAAPKKGSD